MTQNAPALDLDAELSAEAETVRNEARDAVPLGRSALKLDDQVNRLSSAKRKQYTKVVAVSYTHLTLPTILLV